jgi:hypothetical protein
MRSTISLPFKRIIKNHSKAVSVIEKLARFIGDNDWHG